MSDMKAKFINEATPPTADWTRRQLLAQITFSALAASLPLYGSSALANNGPNEAVRTSGKRLVVIGSGIGGMASASLFARLGYKVTVLEMNSLIGGHARHPEIDGLKFSMGPQYVWHFEPGNVGDRFLKFLNIDRQNQFLQMDRDGFETLYIGQGRDKRLRFDVPMGLEFFRNRMIETFPEEADNLARFFGELIMVYQAFSATRTAASFASVESSMDEILNHESLPYGVRERTVSLAFTPLKDWFDRFQLSELVRRILYGHGGIYAENESLVSALFYAVGTGNYHAGARFPRQGFDQLFESMKSIVIRSGGRVQTRKKVVELKLKNNQVEGVKCADGSYYPCDLVFSNISPRLTANLLPATYRPDFNYQPSNAIIACMIGLKGRFAPVADMKGRNYWWIDRGDLETEYQEADVTRHPRMIYITSHTANGFGALSHARGMDSLTLFVPGNFAQEQEIYARGREAVHEFKKQLARNIVEILGRHIFPGIEARLKFANIVSSVDASHEINAEQGSAYGRSFSAFEAQKGPIPELAIDGLYNVSSTQNRAGIANGIATAVQLMHRITGKLI